MQTGQQAVGGQAGGSGFQVQSYRVDHNPPERYLHKRGM